MEKELLLSDAFFDPEGKRSLELRVKGININTSKKHEILEKCEILRQYSVFVDTVRKYKGEQDAIKRAMEIIDSGVDFGLFRQEILTGL